MKIPSLFFKSYETKLNSWQTWPSCKQPKTQSFRAGDQEMFKTVNSVYFDTNIVAAAEGGTDQLETPESWFTTSSSSDQEGASISTDQSELLDNFDGKSLEMVVRGVRSERLFFEPGDTSSILEEAKPGGFPFKESVVLAMESDDPYLDFKKSMEEMVESHGVKDWECLEELLGWYLKVNGKKNHGFIVGAFVDLLVSIAGGGGGGSNCSDSTTSFSSAVSSFSSSSPLCSFEKNSEIEEEEEEEEEEKMVVVTLD